MGDMKGCTIAHIDMKQTRRSGEENANKNADGAVAYLPRLARVLGAVLVCSAMSCERKDDARNSEGSEKIQIQASATRPGEPEGTTNHANKDGIHDAHVAESRLRRKIGDLDERISRDPNDAQAYYERGRARRFLSQYIGLEEKVLSDTAALGDFETAHKQAGERGFAQALVEAGRLCMSQYQFEDASEYFSRAESLDPGDVEVRAELARIEAFATGNWTAALRTLETLSKEPSGKDSPGVHFALGYAYNQLGRFAEAEAAFRKTLELEPLNLRPKLSIAFILKNQGKTTEAIQMHRELLEVNPSDIYAANNLASILVHTDDPADWKEALRIMEEVRDRIPTFPMAWLNLGQASAKLSDYDAAIRAYKKCIDLVPNWADAYYTLSTTYREKHMLPEAIEAIGKAIEIDPSIDDFYRDRGVMRMSAGQWKEAIGDFTAASIRKEPDVYISLWLWMANMHLGKDEEARKSIATAVSMSKAGSWEATLLRYFAGDIERQALLEAASTNEKKCEAYYYIAQRLRVQQGKEEPRQWLQKCVDTGVTHFVEYKLARYELEQE